MKHLFLILMLAATASAQTSKERFQQALGKLNQSGQLAQQGKFAEAQPLMNAALAELDAVVAADPENAELRLMRGSIYAQFPPFLNKAAIARQDLEIAARDTRYGEAAAKALAKLGGDGKPVRFAQIKDDVQPIMAVSSVTFPGKLVTSRDQAPAMLRNLMEEMTAAPGFLGNHMLVSADQPGMILMFTWWTDKQSLAQWVDGPGHQGAIRSIYSQKAEPGQAISTQVGAELFHPLPGSQQFNGGLTPAKAAAMLNKQLDKQLDKKMDKR